MSSVAEYNFYKRHYLYLAFFHWYSKIIFPIQIHNLYILECISQTERILFHRFIGYWYFPRSYSFPENNYIFCYNIYVQWYKGNRFNKIKIRWTTISWINCCRFIWTILLHLYFFTDRKKQSLYYIRHQFKFIIS